MYGQLPILQVQRVVDLVNHVAVHEGLTSHFCIVVRVDFGEAFDKRWFTKFGDGTTINLAGKPYRPTPACGGARPLPAPSHVRLTTNERRCIADHGYQKSAKRRQSSTAAA